MLALGVIGGALWGLIPAFLKTRFGVNEILTSLMLVYVAQLVLDYLTRGPWRDPKGFNFPQSVTFDPAATLPPVIEGSRVHGASCSRCSRSSSPRSWSGAPSSATGFDSRATRRERRGLPGFSSSSTTLSVFATRAGLAGLAGISEVAGADRAAPALDFAGYASRPSRSRSSDG
jgi:simple sugar transport system permease protein